MREDERRLLDTLKARRDLCPCVRDVSRELGIRASRATAICAGWRDRGWYEYGVSALQGWLTLDGLAEIGGQE